jgi:predicted ATPase/class 3 adenylate cyclase
LPDQPTGTVTFLFTDIEGSTRLWEQHPESMGRALARHDALLTEQIEQHGGHVVRSRGEGDSFFAVFARATDALAAVCALQQALLTELWPDDGAPLRVRAALHTGEAEWRQKDYYGAAVNRCARLRAVAHGGQTLVSAATQELVRDQLPAGASLRDLGSHRLKDLQHPEQLFQLLHPALPADFPPLRSLAAFAHNLPVQLTRFIGREKEMAEVKRLLAASRLLTLTGSGGCGKTRLALQVAAEVLEEYPDGVWLVELAALADPALVVQLVVSALGICEEPSRPLIQTLMDYLRSKQLLLVMDNCEHLLTACASLADTLLRSCPHLRLLASSREGLGIAGEQTYRVPSLSVPDLQQLPSPEGLQEFEAVQLFAARAALSQPAFAVTAANAPAVVQVCQRLDGIPLAIELAAARVKALPVEKIAERLDDRFRLLTGGSRTALPRQQTLRALIDWSYDLLSEPERALLRRLSVFVSGWTLDAAEAVCSDFRVREAAQIQNPECETQSADVLDLLTQLVEKSLVVYEEPGSQAEPGWGAARYRLLETVRQYARDRLLEAGDAVSARNRHLGFFVHLSLQAEPQLRGPEQAEWLNRLETEHDNLRAALTWSMVDPEVETALRLVEALATFMYAQGHLSEAREWVASLLPLIRNQPTAARATALGLAGNLAWQQGDLEPAHGFYEESLAIWRDLGDQERIAESFHGIAKVVEHQGDLEKARLLFQQCLAIRQQVSHPVQIAMANFGLGWVALKLGEYRVARDYFEEGRAMSQRARNPLMIAWGLRNLGEVAQSEGDRDAARAYYAESLPIMHDKWGLTGLLASMGALALEEGDYGTARSSFCKSLRLIHELGLKSQAGLLTAALAEVDFHVGNHVRAAQLLGASASLPEPVGTSLPLSFRRDPARTAAAVRAAMGEEAFAADWAEGRSMTLEQAIQYALEAADA